MNISKINESFIKNNFFTPDKFSNKYDQGKLLVLAGSQGMTGAACLSAMSAYRSGTGLVKVVVPKSLNSIFEIKLTESMTIPVEDQGCGFLRIENKSNIIKHLEWADAILIGPGLGREKTTGELVKSILEFSNKTIILDADGLFYFSEKLNFLNNLKSEIILTPHFYEFSRLFNISYEQVNEDQLRSLLKIQNEINKIVVLKGPTTFISYGDKLMQNTTGNQGLAVGGSGDILSGMISSFVCQGFSPIIASAIGVFLHGKTADELLKIKGVRGLIPSDLIDMLPTVLKKYEIL
tara:strand:- start:423 stop:1301 length:879 start_codon:yes stop_codon:yes gene_type:complete